MLDGGALNSGDVIHGDLQRGELIRHEKARDGQVPESTAPTTADEALRLAIKLAVDAGDYDRAAALLDVAKRPTPKTASVTPLAVARERGRT